MTYDEWYARCDRTCINLSGVGIDDLPDGPSRDAYDDGMPVLEYVLAQLEEAGFPNEPPTPTPRSDGMIRVAVPLSPHQWVTAPTRAAAAKLLVRRHGVTPAEAAQAVADA